MSENKKKKNNFIYILFWLYTIFVLIWTFFGFDMDYFHSLGRRGHPSSAPHKACLSNCRVIMGGIEMYNMDHDHDYKSEYIPLDPSGTVLEGYYKPISNPRSECFYWYKVEDTEVSCVRHGTPSNPNPDYENSCVKFEPTDEQIKKSYKQYLKKAKSKHWQEYIKAFPSRFFCGLLMPFYLIFNFVLLIISLIFEPIFRKIF